MRHLPTLSIVLVASALLADQPKLAVAQPDNAATYKGKTLAEWDDRARSDNQDIQFEAIGQALPKLGPAGIRAIAKLLGEGEKYRLCGALTLAQIGPEAEPAVPAMVESLKNKDWFWLERMYVEGALENLGPRSADAVARLSVLCADDNESVRRQAAEILGVIGHRARPAVPALVLLLKDNEQMVRGEAIKALGNIGPAAAPALRELLERGPMGERSGAAAALGQIGADARSAAPLLEELLKTGSDWERTSAAVALLRIDPQSETAWPAIKRLIAQEDWPVRRQLATDLGRRRSGSRCDAHPTAQRPDAVGAGRRRQIAGQDRRQGRSRTCRNGQG